MGRGIHPLNLAVQGFLKEEGELLAKINKVVRKVCNLVVGAKLRRF